MIKSFLEYINETDNHEETDFPFRVEQHPEKKTNPTEHIHQLVRKFGKSPFKINDGRCSEFANEFIKRCGGSVWETHHESDMSHTFVEHSGKFYDAESPNGVEHWSQLPLFKRQMPSINTSRLRAFEQLHPSNRKLKTYRKDK